MFHGFTMLLEHEEKLAQKLYRGTLGLHPPSCSGRMRMWKSIVCQVTAESISKGCHQNVFLCCFVLWFLWMLSRVLNTRSISNVNISREQLCFKNGKGKYCGQGGESVEREWKNKPFWVTFKYYVQSLTLHNRVMSEVWSEPRVPIRDPGVLHHVQEVVVCHKLPTSLAFLLFLLLLPRWFLRI